MTALASSKPQGAVFGLFGLSGVGKTWLADRLVERFPALLHLEASSLLKAAHQAEGEALRTSGRDRLIANQEALATAFADARAAQQERPVLISAHTVIDNEAELVEVPFSAIQPLGISYYLFLAADPEVIAARRANSSRQRPARSIAVLAEHQRRACEVCQSYAEGSGRPFLLLDQSGSDRSLEQAIAAVGSAVA